MLQIVDVGSRSLDRYEPIVGHTAIGLQGAGFALTKQAQELGMLGRHHVKEHFLITGLLSDELRLLRSLA